MKFCYAGILGTFYLALSQPALAAEKQTKIDIGKDKGSVEEKTQKSISNRQKDVTIGYEYILE